MVVENNKPADTGAAPRNGTAPPVATGPTPGQPGNAPAPVPAKTSVADFGGNPTGRKSKFRFPADTPQGVEERRKADNERKAAARAVAEQLREPPPLPAAVARAPIDNGTTPGSGESALVPAPVAEMVVPWTAADVKEFTDELVDLSEAKRVSDFVAAAKEAKLPDALVREIETDARFPAKSKAGLKTAIAACAAKWLNKAGFSSRNKEETALCFFGLSLLLQGRRLRAKLDELIRDDQERKQKAEEKAKALAA